MFKSPEISAAGAAIIGAVVGAAASLIGQWIVGRWGLKHREADIYLSNKVTAYAELFGAVYEVNNAPRDEVKYANYRTAFERAKMFASEEVRTILEGEEKPGPDTLVYAIQRLRRSEDKAEADEVRTKEFYQAMERLSDACRRDSLPDQQPGEFTFHRDQAAGAGVEISRGRKGTHGAA